MSDYKRPSWDEYFFEVMKAIAKRGTCDRGRAQGCVIVRDRQILTTGYVGSVSGGKHCDEIGHLMRKVINEDGTISQHCVRTVHAEQNAICQAAKRGVSLEGATLYCNMTPCRVCAMLIIQCGIKKVYCLEKYHRGQDGIELFKEAGVELKIWSDTTVKYENQ